MALSVLTADNAVATLLALKRDNQFSRNFTFTHGPDTVCVGIKARLFVEVDLATPKACTASEARAFGLLLTVLAQQGLAQTFEKMQWRSSDAEWDMAARNAVAGDFWTRAQASDRPGNNAPPNHPGEIIYVYEYP